MDFTKGEDRLLFIKVNGSYVPVGCISAFSFDEQSEFIETTTRDNNGWNTSRPINQDYTFNFTGIQVNTMVAGGNFDLASYDRIRDFKRKKILVDWKLQGTIYPIVDFGKCYIQSISVSENVSEFITFSVNVIGYGEPKQQSLNSVLLNNGNPETIINNGNTDVLIRIGEI